jgi:hypothetical protein
MRGVAESWMWLHGGSPTPCSTAGAGSRRVRPDRARAVVVGPPHRVDTCDLRRPVWAILTRQRYVYFIGTPASPRDNRTAGDRPGRARGGRVMTREEASRSGVRRLWCRAGKSDPTPNSKIFDAVDAVQTPSTSVRSPESIALTTGARGQATGSGGLREESSRLVRLQPAADDIRLSSHNGRRPTTTQS